MCPTSVQGITEHLSSFLGQPITLVTLVSVSNACSRYQLQLVAGNLSLHCKGLFPSQFYCQLEQPIYFSHCQQRNLSVLFSDKCFEVVAFASVLLFIALVVRGNQQFTVLQLTYTTLVLIQCYKYSIHETLLQFRKCL